MSVEEPTVHQQQQDEEAGRKAAEPEVRSEEFTAGVGPTVSDGAWDGAVVDELAAPLDPNRVRRREGRGGTQLEYLAGHDVKRRASQIFGFGMWGHRVVEIVALGDPVPVKSRDGNKEGFHVAFRCVVRVWVEREGRERYETDGVGYGDGVEYGAAAALQACELAVKESETDALKRAFTDLGDQFGLILYAKGDEKARISRERNRDDAVAVRVEAAGPPKPQNWTDALTRFDALVGVNVAADDYDAKKGEAAAWLEELTEKRFGEMSLQALSAEQRRVAFIGFSSALMQLEEKHGDLALTEGVRQIIVQAFSDKNDGVTLDGPAWALDAAEAKAGPRPARQTT